MSLPSYVNMLDAFEPEEPEMQEDLEAVARLYGATISEMEE